MRLSFFTIAFLFLFTGLHAQNPKKAQSSVPDPLSDTSHIQIKNADFLEVIQYHHQNTYRLINNVILTQKNVTLYCDSALFFNTKNIVKAYGHVHFNQSDTVNAYGDSAIYDGNTKIANLYQHVKLTNRNMVLTTEFLTYDLNTRVASYFNGGELDNGETKLTSATGYYYAYSADAYFKKDVKLTHPKYNLEADTLQYNTDIDRAYFHGPTKIYNKEDTILCVSGYYDSKTGLAVFNKGVTLKDPPQFLEADSIYYNREAGLGKAYRNIIFQDTSQHIIQYSNYAIYDEIKNIILSTKQPVAAYIIKNDTLFIGADSIRSVQDSLKHRTMYAWHHVKIYKSDMQGSCDSLIYADLDSTIRLYGAPIMWSDSTQFTADTMHLLIKNKQLSKIEMYSNGFIVNEDDSLLYNQIKGRDIYGYFIDQELSKIQVIGNGESIYYGKDDKGGYLGVNKMICTDIDLWLKDRKFTKIAFKVNPDSHFYPMQNVNPKEYQLKDFQWRYDERPKSRYDLLSPVTTEAQR